MKRSLLVLAAAAALTGLAHAEGAVEQAPANLIAMADLSDRGYTVPARSAAEYLNTTRADLEQVAVDLSKKLEARMEQDLQQLAMQ